MAVSRGRPDVSCLSRLAGWRFWSVSTKCLCVRALMCKKFSAREPHCVTASVGLRRIYLLTYLPIYLVAHLPACLPVYLSIDRPIYRSRAFVILHPKNIGRLHPNPPPIHNNRNVKLIFDIVFYIDVLIACSTSLNYSPNAMPHSVLPLLV